MPHIFHAHSTPIVIIGNTHRAYSVSALVLASATELYIMEASYIHIAMRTPYVP